MKKITIILIFIISNNIFSQTIIRYKSDFTVKYKVALDESRDGGNIEDTIKMDVEIIHNTLEKTVEVELSENRKKLFFFKKVNFKETFYNGSEKYNSYNAEDNEGNKYYISFNKSYIKIDHRAKYTGFGFKLKNKK